MEEELQIFKKVRQESWHFYPSHLTKGLVYSYLSISFALYAAREFSQVGRDKYPLP
jgi:hypothetical protein